MKKRFPFIGVSGVEGTDLAVDKRAVLLESGRYVVGNDVKEKDKLLASQLADNLCHVCF